AGLLVAAAAVAVIVHEGDAGAAVGADREAGDAVVLVEVADGDLRKDDPAPLDEDDAVVERVERARRGDVSDVDGRGGDVLLEADRLALGLLEVDGADL